MFVHSARFLNRLISHLFTSKLRFYEAYRTQLDAQNAHLSDVIPRFWE
jgi:hypothetical protein